MKYTETNPPMQCMMTHSTWYQGAVTNSKPIGILWHDTAAGNPDLKRYVQPYETDDNYNKLLSALGYNKYGNDWNHAARNAGVNAFIGKLARGNVASVQVGEWTMAPWGCGGGDLGSCNGYVRKNGNVDWIGQHWIQFEICDDGYVSKDYFNTVFEEACQLTAYFCKMYGLDPKGTVKFAGIDVPVILCHQDSYQLKLGSDHDDTLRWFKKFGKTMNDVRDRVKRILEDINPKPTVFHKGDLVKIIGDTYYSGKKIPAWVRGQNWYVYSAPEGSDRIVINENESHTDSIMSPVNSKDLKLIQSAQTIEIGDLVKITGDTYYSGKKIPAWVKNQNWYVKSAPANSDRIVIDKNEAGTESICSPVNRKDLEIVKKA